LVLIPLSVFEKEEPACRRWFGLESDNADLVSRASTFAELWRDIEQRAYILPIAIRI